MTLTELNDHWREGGRPHAVNVNEGSYRWRCPCCKKTGEVDLPLHAAMSDAITHKNHCSELG